MEFGTNILDHGHDQSRDEVYHRAAELLQLALFEETDGSFSTKIYHGAGLGNELRMMEKLISGDLALANVTAANAAVFIPELGLFSAPYLFLDGDHFSRAMMTPDMKQIFGDKIRARFPDLECIACFTPGSRNIYSHSLPITGPDDLAGLRLRVMASPIEARIWASLGATPVPLPFADIENAMKSGKIDAAEDTAAVYATQRHYEIAPYHSRTSHQWSVAMIIANTKLAGEISEILPKALRAAGGRISMPAIEIAIGDEISKTEALRQRPDVNLIKADTNAFKAATKQMLSEISEETAMQQALNIIQKSTIMTDPMKEQAHV